MNYQGRCHCGNVKFSFTMPVPIEENEVVKCNCSICTKNGYLMIYPNLSDATFDHPKDSVQEYRFASKMYPHFFCKSCGSSLYAKGPEGSDMLAVNIRFVEGLDIDKLKLKPFDGKNLDPDKLKREPCDRRSL
ncbi:Mss4-like protein [Aspergillus crustosus]